MRSWSREESYPKDMCYLLKIRYTYYIIMYREKTMRDYDEHKITGKNIRFIK